MISDKITDFLQATKELPTIYGGEHAIESLVNQLLLMNWKQSHLDGLTQKE